EPKEDQAGKRRAQVRRAQQTYRLRRDHYTKSLEHEVARLRAIETNLLHEIQRLRSTIQTLESLPRDQGIHIDLPTLTSPASEGRGSEPGAPRSTNLDSAAKSQLVVSQVPPVEEPLSLWPEVWQNTCLVSQQGDLTGSPDCNVRLTSDHQVLAIPTAAGYQRHQLGDVDTVTLGMEFVLALEKPCLVHIHGDPSNTSQPAGHALTVSSHLLAITPPSYPSPPSPDVLHQACGTTPASILDRLLTLSANLAVNEGEVTPVKAWNRILPHFDMLGVDNLRAMTTKLAGAVTCHGFGAVLKEAVFDKLLREVLAERLMAWDRLRKNGKR
ncbi:hypothetical protein C8A01DRAFT_20756, partial [Parachaetomium inaequale]